MDAVFVGLDLGTSSLKGAAVEDSSGAVVATASAGYPTHRPAPGAAEQDVADWLDAVRAVVRELAAQSPSHGWRGVGLSAMLPTLVAPGAGGVPTSRAVTWEDARAEREGERFRAAVGGDALYEITGQWVDGRYLLPMWQRAAVESSRAPAPQVLGAKDVLFGWLTGAPATDPSTAAGYGCYDLAEAAWSAHVLAAAAPGLRAADLPPVLPPTTARPLTAERAAWLGLPAGMPVVLGAADSVLGAYGLGVREPGDVAYLAGTSTVVLGVSPELVRDHRHRYLATPLAVGSGWGLEMDLLSTGSAVRWLAGIAGIAGMAGIAGRRVDEGALLELAGGVDPLAASLPVFLPYLAPGEQGALWDPGLTGGVTGLDLSHGLPELARALVNGILVESRRCLSVLQTACGGAGPVRLAGRTTAGGFGQDLADATGRVVRRPASSAVAESSSAVGAALLARLAIAYRPPPDGDAQQPDAVWTPDLSRETAWSALADHHDRARRALRGLGPARPGSTEDRGVTA